MSPTKAAKVETCPLDEPLEHAHFWAAVQRGVDGGIKLTVCSSRGLEQSRC